MENQEINKIIKQAMALKSRQTPAPIVIAADMVERGLAQYVGRPMSVTIKLTDHGENIGKTLRSEALTLTLEEVEVE